MAAELLEPSGFALSVVNMPWLNRFDMSWLGQTLEPHQLVFVLEDHLMTGGLGDRMLNAMLLGDLLAARRLIKLGLEVLPACGTPIEVLRFHELDGRSIASRILKEGGGSELQASAKTAESVESLESAQ